jgi:hypothetical protein
MRNVEITRTRGSDVLKWVEEESRRLDPMGGGIIIDQGQFNDYLRCHIKSFSLENSSVMAVAEKVCSEAGLVLAVGGNRASVAIDIPRLKEDYLKDPISTGWLLDAKAYAFGRDLEPLDRLLVLNTIDPVKTHVEGTRERQHHISVYFVANARFAEFFACSGAWSRDSWHLATDDGIVLQGYPYRLGRNCVDVLYLYLESKYDPDSFATDIVALLDAPTEEGTNAITKETNASSEDPPD